MRAVIQVIETERRWDDAYAALMCLHTQEGFLGGRLYRRDARWHVQAFFDPPLAYDPQSWLPDGMRFVWLAGRTRARVRRRQPGDAVTMARPAIAIPDTRAWTGGTRPPVEVRTSATYRAVRRVLFRESLRLCGGLDFWKCAGTSSMERARIFWRWASYDAWATVGQQIPADSERR